MAFGINTVQFWWRLFRDAARSCPTCHRGPIRHLDVAAHYHLGLISGCESCGLVFLNPPPSALSVAAQYQAGGAWESKLGARAERNAKGDPRDRAQANGEMQHDSFRSEWRRLYMDGARRVLDFGCGAGRLLDNMQSDGWDTTGIDPVTAGTITRHKVLVELPAQPMFDVVVMKHVLEHILDPLTTLRAVRRVLVEGGHLLIATPTIDGLAEHGYKDYCINRHHVTAYTTQSLESLLARAGFSVVKPIGRRQPHRMAFLAATANTAAISLDPLSSARREFARAALTENGPIVGRLPVTARLIPMPRLSTSSRSLF